MFSYWLGSQAMGQPLYQYRLILAEDDKMLNVATDMDFNVEGEARYPLMLPFLTKAGVKVNFTVLRNRIIVIILFVAR